MDSANIIEIDTAMGRLKRMKSTVLTRARLIQHGNNIRGFRVAFVTLTYREVDQWEPKHITSFLKNLRTWAQRRGLKTLRYVWVAELQKRGAVHYHALVWLPKKLSMPKPDKQGWWPHGSSNVKWAQKPVGYIAKYASKSESKNEAGHSFPKGCRLHGAGGISPTDRMAVRWWQLPGYMREAVFPADDVRRAIGGGFVSRVTGELWSSCYGLVLASRGLVRVIRIADEPPRRPERSLSDPSWLSAWRGLDALPDQL